jgi:hypothetical protein
MEIIRLLEQRKYRGFSMYCTNTRKNSVKLQKYEKHSIKFILNSMW